MKKLIAIILAIALMFAVTVTLTQTAYADGPAHTITIKNHDAAETHEYTAYRIFSGDYDYATGALSNVGWGDGVSTPAFLEALRSGIPAFAECETAAQVVQVLSGFASDSDEIRAFAAVADSYLATPSGTGTASASTPAVISVEGDGYYYVKDTSANLSADTYSDYILLVEGDVTVEAKDSTGVVSQKKVKDINDSTQEGSDWQDSADYDIGDPVPFQISGAVAGDYDKYDSYKLIFHDKESAGLTYDHITGVFVDGAEITTGYSVNTDCDDGCTFEVVFENLKAIPAVHGGSTVSVEYLSVLNEDAVIGVPGNPDEMRMEYSNNPTDETSTGFTPWDKVVVFTYEVIVEKTDESGEKLPGAAFSLEKWVIDEEYPEGHWVEVPGEIAEDEGSGLGRVQTINGKPTRMYEIDGVKWYKLRDKPTYEAIETDIWLKASELDAVNDLVLGGMEVGVPYYEMKEDGTIVQVTGNFGYNVKALTRAANDGATFLWNGIDDGHYRITETETPPGYNTMDPVEFDVIAEHETESEDPLLISVDGSPFMPTEENIGVLTCEIINVSGGLLPSTGGIGTTIFYVLGGILVIGAGVVMVVRRRTDVQ